MLRRRPARSTTRRRRRRGWLRSIILALFERLRVTRADSFEHVHGIVEATKRAFRVRDRVVTDPDKITADLDQYLSPAFLDAEAAKIDARKAARLARASAAKAIRSGWARRTRAGLVVSYIQSLYWEFGSGCVLPATGIVMQNRGASSRSIRRRSTRSRPAAGRSTRSIRRLAVLRDGRIIAYGTMGGDGQPQNQAAVFTAPCRRSASRSTKRLTRAARWLLGRTGDRTTQTRGWNPVSGWQFD